MLINFPNRRRQPVGNPAFTAEVQREAQAVYILTGEWPATQHSRGERGAVAV
jgi:hypothetical protein